MFTNEGLRLFAMWEADPNKKKRFSKLAVGTLTDEQKATAYTGNETALRGEYTQSFNVDDVKTDDPDKTIARVRATVTPLPAIQGKTIREVGLFAPNENNIEKLVWIGLFTDTYIPDSISDPSLQVSLIITVPIKFNNAAAIYIYTDNEALAKQRDLDSLTTRTKILEKRWAPLEMDLTTDMTVLAATATVKGVFMGWDPNIDTTPNIVKINPTIQQVVTNALSPLFTYSRPLKKVGDTEMLVTSKTKFILNCSQNNYDYDQNIQISSRFEIQGETNFGIFNWTAIASGILDRRDGEGTKTFNIPMIFVFQLPGDDGDEFRFSILDSLAGSSNNRYHNFRGTIFEYDSEADEYIHD